MKITIEVSREVETFGDYIKFIRQARFGETLKGMGDKYGASRQYVDQVERDFPVSVETIAEVCKSYGITAKEIKAIEPIITPNAKYRKLYGERAKGIWVEDLCRKVEQ